MLDQMLAIALILVVVSVFALIAALRDVLREDNRLTPARRTWLRIATIFAVVAVALVGYRMIFP